MKNIIYDVGSNNGDDIPYYMMKGDVVVAIEANPVLCEGIRQRFAAEIQEGRLIVECCVVTDCEAPEVVDFYLHNKNHVVSQFPIPSEDRLELFTRIELPSRSILSIISEHGFPYYVKIDIEHFDVPLLKAMFSSDIRPPFISAESHSLEVLSTLAGQGCYTAFKLVDGPTVSRVYTDRLIESNFAQQKIRYSFPHHSAGPFGDDIDGDWLSFDSILKLLSVVGLGWKDIHATNVRKAEPMSRPRFAMYLDGLISLDDLLSYTVNRTVRSSAARLKHVLDRLSWMSRDLS